MRLGPVDLPQALLDAQRAGTLVVFAGAGVSVAPPANLPNFEQLVQRIAAGAPLVRSDGEPLDRFLGRLETSGVDVQRRTRDLLGNPASCPTPLHRDLLGLFGLPERVRVVTTNFDPHFGTAAAELWPDAPVDCYVGPAVPLGRDLWGLVHLHGALRARHRLVLTDADFGRAYLTDGWARRFLTELFQHYTVLFVGYSHNDPITGHLARSLPPQTARFALTEPGRDGDWRHLGITPVEFPRQPGPDAFAALGTVVARWRERAHMGVFDHEPRIRALAAGAPPIDPEDVDYLRAVLSDPVLTDVFAKAASGTVWLKWLDGQGLLDSLFQRDAPVPDATRHLAWWIAERFAVSYAEATLDLVRDRRERGGALHAQLIGALLITLRRQLPPPLVLSAWIAAVLQGLPSTWFADELAYLLTRCTRPEDATTVLLLVEHLTRPQLVLERRWWALRASTEEDADAPQAAEDGTATFDDTIARGAHGNQSDAPDTAVDARPALRLAGSVGLVAGAHAQHHLRDAWDSVLQPRLGAIHADLLLIATAHLAAAHRLYRSVGNADASWDPWSARRSAIEPHGQDAYPGTADVLIDLARDVLTYLIAQDPPRAAALAAGWYDSPVALLRRLAVHATAELPIPNPDDALARVIARRWLADGAAKHEVFRLVARAYPDASAASRHALINHSLEADLWVTADAEAADVPTADAAARHAAIAESRAYAEYNFAVWLAQSAPADPIAAAHLAAIQARHPKWRPREYPDLDSWSSGVYTSGPRTPVSAEALMARPAAEWVEYLRTYAGPEETDDADDVRGRPTRSGLLATLHQATQQAPAWGVELAGALPYAAAREWDVWEALLSGWAAADLTPQEWRPVLGALEEGSVVVEAVPEAVARVLTHRLGRDVRDLEAADVDVVERLADRVYTAAAAAPRARGADESWTHTARSHPAGEAADVWLRALAQRLRLAGGVHTDAWAGLPDAYRRRFESALASEHASGRLATVVLASNTRFLIAVDPAWTRAHLAPMFDWAADAERAGEVFDGLLSSVYPDDAVWDALGAQYVAGFARLAAAAAPVREGLVRHLVWAAVYGTAHPLGDAGWLWAFVRDAGDDARTRWAKGVGQTLQHLSPEAGRALWTRWIERYWDDRLTGVPRPLARDEANAMAAWALGLRAVFPAAVDRVCASAADPELHDVPPYQLQEDPSIAAEHPIAALKLLTFLLGKRSGPFYDCEYLETIVREALRAGASRQALLDACELLARGSCAGAAALRHDVEHGSPAG